MRKFVYYSFKISSSVTIPLEVLDKIVSSEKGSVTTRKTDPEHTYVRVHADDTDVVSYLLERDSSQEGHLITLRYGVAAGRQFYANHKTFRTSLALTLQDAYEIAVGEKHREMNEACFTITKSLRQKRDHQLEQYALDKLDPPASYNTDDIEKLKRKHKDKIEHIDFKILCAEQIITEAQSYIKRLNRLYGIANSA